MLIWHCRSPIVLMFWKQEKYHSAAALKSLQPVKKYARHIWADKYYLVMKGANDMFVSNYMTKNPITVSPITPVDEASGLMKMNHFRRLPVVENGKVVGIVSDRDISRVEPSPATTLSKYEINSLLAKMTVNDIMSAPIVVRVP